MNMPEDDPRRMDEIRKYAAIYGRFDCKRKPEKPLTLHEVSPHVFYKIISRSIRVGVSSLKIQLLFRIDSFEKLFIFHVFITSAQSLPHFKP